MKIGLNPDAINRKFSREAIEGSFQTVKTNFDFDRSQPYENYYCTMVLMVSHVRDWPNQCRLMSINKSDKLVPSFHFLDVKNIPEEMLASAKKSRKAFIHVLVRMRFFYNDRHEITLVLHPKQKRLGYFSNTHLLTNAGLASLEDKNLSLKRRVLLKLHRFAAHIPQLAVMLNLAVPTPYKKAA